MSSFKELSESKKTFYLTIAVILLSVNSYYFDYTWPNLFYWDEVYHVASAQKYLNGVFFLEQHPPLGKLLIAAGEWLFSVNPLNDQFIHVEFAESYPKDHSMLGYRFFPAFLGWMTAPLFFWLLFQLTNNRLVAFFLSFLYIFDDALIIQSRAAMLDSMLIFFLVAAMTITVGTLREKAQPQDRPFTPAKIFGLLFAAGLCVGAATSVKLTGLIGMALFLPVFWKYRHHPMQFLTLGSLFTAGVILSIVMSFAVHLGISQTIEPRLLDDQRVQFSDSFKRDLKESLSVKLQHLPEVIKKSLQFTFTYNHGVVKTNLCLEGQNASPSFLWPIGGRAINYVWEPVDDSTNKYIFLHANPAGWLITLSGIFVATVLVLTPVFHRTKIQLQHAPFLLTCLLMYFAYMIIISLVDRQMYLYHYFPALLFGFIILSLAIMNLQKIGPWFLKTQHREMTSIAIGLLVFFSYQQYRPLIYYQSITHEQLEQLAIIDNWDLRCPDCELTNTLASPVKPAVEENEKP